MQFCVIKTVTMKQLLQAEEAAQLAISIFGLYLQPLEFTWWVWIILFLSPDISMLGYLINPKIGAFTYNVFHHKLIGVLVTGIGYATAQPVLLLIGLILLAHSCFDRMMGYGLKFTNDFKHTHLGWIGKSSIEEK